MKKLLNVADVKAFLNETGIFFDANSIRKVRLPRSKELFWSFLGDSRIYTLDAQGGLVLVI